MPFSFLSVASHHPCKDPVFFLQDSFFKSKNCINALLHSFHLFIFGPKKRSRVLFFFVFFDQLNQYGHARGVSKSESPHIFLLRSKSFAEMINLPFPVIHSFHSFHPLLAYFGEFPESRFLSSLWSNLTALATPWGAVLRPAGFGHFPQLCRTFFSSPPTGPIMRQRKTGKERERARRSSWKVTFTWFCPRESGDWPATWHESCTFFHPRKVYVLFLPAFPLWKPVRIERVNSLWSAGLWKSFTAVDWRIVCGAYRFC